MILPVPAARDEEQPRDRSARSSVAGAATCTRSRRAAAPICACAAARRFRAAARPSCSASRTSRPGAATGSPPTRRSASARATRSAPPSGSPRSTAAPSRRTGQVAGADGERLATLDYGHAATIWRINFGWRRRENPEQLGFVLDTERGYWAATTSCRDQDVIDAARTRCPGPPGA